MPDSSTILLVDDEDAVQKLLAYPLERDGFRVVQARDGEEALARFAEQRFDLVVLDLMLPKLDGLEVCKRLRATSSVPIIMLTARDDELDKVLGLELGADDYITKPFSIREFRSRVRALAAPGGASRAPREATRRRSSATGCGSTWPGGTWTSTASRSADVRRVRAAAHDGGQPRPRVFTRKCCCRRSGAAPTTASRARSTSTSATCARSSSATRASRSSS